MERLQLPRPLVNQILTQAQQSPEAEICGLISGVDGQAQRCYPVSNTAAEPGRLYTMDPQGQIEAMRRMREAGEELLAIYHSHPHGAALPSAIDIAEAQYPQAIYLIVSLNTEGVLEMSAFRIRDGASAQVELSL